MPSSEHAAALAGVLERRRAELPRDREVVAYCRGPYCVYSDEAAEMLQRHGFTVRRLEEGFPEWWLEGVPEATIASFAGTGNPFSLGVLGPGERVVDIGSGAGIDSLIAANTVGTSGRVIGIDMTPAMLDKARTSAHSAGMSNVEFREGFGESLPVEDGWADVVISNGALNLMPDKDAALREMARGRCQLAEAQRGWTR